jgi:hypothetical protein
MELRIASRTLSIDASGQEAPLVIRSVGMWVDFSRIKSKNPFVLSNF